MLPSSMRRLHYLWVLHDVRVDVVNTVHVITAGGGKGGVEFTSRVSGSR